METHMKEHNNIMNVILPLILMTLTLVACAPSENAVQTAIFQTQQALPTATIIFTDTPEPTPTFTPIPTPDIRVIDVDPQQLLLKKEDLPSEGRYILPGPGWISPVTNSEIVSSWTVEQGREYLSETGRIDGWLVDYKRSNNNVLLPEEIYDNVSLYSNFTGAQLVITKYSERRITEEHRTEIANPPLIGDVTRAFVKKDTDVSGNTRVSYMISFSYRNVAHTVLVWGWEQEVTLEHAVNIANILLQQLKELSLSDSVTYRP